MTITPQMAGALVLLAASMVLLISEWIPMEATALLVLGICALTGLVSPESALAGFSNPAVVTVWAVFILSGSLQRTGVVNMIGRHLMRLAGRSEARITVVLMTSAGVMSAFMNNVAVAALLLPVTMDIARRRALPPSRLLMPLAFGSLLGGLTTMIGTPPNILVSDLLREAGLRRFGLFDYTPVGVTIMLAGIVFMSTAGRRMLPRRDVASVVNGSGAKDLQSQYDLRPRMFEMRVRTGSRLVGKTLSESRLGSTLGLHVVGITRKVKSILAPSPDEVLQGDDLLLAQGRLEQFHDVSGWRELELEDTPISWDHLVAGEIELMEGRLPHGSRLEGRTPREVEFRLRFGINVVALSRESTLRRTGLQDELLRAGDALLLQGPREKLDAFKAAHHLEDMRPATAERLKENYRLDERLRVLRVREGNRLIGRTLAESRLGNALGAQVLGILRDQGKLLMPAPDETIRAGDLLVVAARLEDLEVAKALEGLDVEKELPADAVLESERVGLMEAILSPRTALAGKTLRMLSFREKFGLSVLAIWREGRAHRTNLRDMPLRLGDALLLYGSRQKLRLLGREPDFVVLTEVVQEVPHVEKARLAMLIMLAVLVPVVLGVVPIHIAAVVGSALMVMARCLTMEEAYRSIEWKAIFLIAGMLPLGTALDQTGAAQWLAQGVVSVMGPLGPRAVMLGLVMVTFVATCIVPTAALVVLMAPIVLGAAADMGVSPHALMMAMAMAASSSFTSPVSHPANLMVMGPGGYRFSDYIKAGTALTLVVLVIIFLVVPFFWPL